MNANKTMYRYEYGIVTRIVDGDGFYLLNQSSNQEIEIRLLGIDAPEINKCKKLLQDERETHVPGDLLIQLGLISKKILVALLPVGTRILYRCADKNSVDVYSRILAYAYLPDGRCINEELLKMGYVKPLDKYTCDEIIVYKALNAVARLNKRGLYNLVSNY